MAGQTLHSAVNVLWGWGTGDAVELGGEVNFLVIHLFVRSFIRSTHIDGGALIKRPRLVMKKPRPAGQTT